MGSTFGTPWLLGFLRAGVHVRSVPSYDDSYLSHTFDAGYNLAGG